jgi:hypothetical protein
MAAFPATLYPSPASAINVDRGMKTYTTQGGGVRGRVQFAEALYHLTLVYENLTDAEHDSIIDHFEAGPTDPHTVSVRAETYDVTYQNQPEVTEHRGILRTVQVAFIGTKQ